MLPIVMVPVIDTFRQMTPTVPLRVAVADTDSTLSDLLADVSEVDLQVGLPGASAPANGARLPDCLVVTDPNLDPGVVETVKRGRIPVIVVTEMPLSAFIEDEHIAGYVRPGETDADTRSHLLDELRWVTGHETRQQLRESTDRVTALHDATTTLVGATTTDELYRRTVDVANDILEFDICYVGTVEGEKIVPRAVSSDAPERGARTMHIDEGIAGKTYRTGESQLVRRVEEASEVEPARSEYQSGISVAIGDHGVFQAVATEPDMFDEQDLQLTELLIGHVAETLTRLKAEQSIRIRERKITRLHEGVTDLVSARSVEDLFQRTVEVAEGILEFDQSYVFVVEDGEFVTAAGAARDDPVDVGRLQMGRGALGETYRTGESRLTLDIEQDSVAEPVSGVFGSGISVPIDDVGVFQAVARDTRRFDETDLELAELLISHVTATLKRIEAESGLRSERDRLDALFENIPDAAIAFEFEGGQPIVQRVNSAFERVFGYGADEVVGENIDERIVPDGVATEANTFNEGLKSGTSLRAEVRRETADGPRDFLLHVVPISLDETNSGGYAIYTDVTEQKERERQLRRQNERLDEFASIVSHDLRNPLTVADGYLELARETATGGEAELERVADALDRMNALVEDLLTLARKGKVVGETSRIDLDEAAREAWTHLATADATLSVDTGLTLDADEPRLVELLGNLFRNAIEHGEASAVRIEGTAEGFAVEDDGHGIPVAERDEVFETGYTTTTDGTGFGLTIVRQIAEAHGWTVSVGGDDGGGARFEFEV
ncbi:PAS domain S-box-containing protein [Halogranum gelatinilyticum]|uniref:histidine kinase n=1 Tax=Halogranum gelatinilyticum TaxID=660521 RepID=A0A1G9PFJ4_9EURY|nr:PAS domain S-box-containing protein [Halogranum gelatinilyticum]